MLANLRIPRKKSRRALQEQLGAVIVMGSNVQNTPQLLYQYVR